MKKTLLILTITGALTACGGSDSNTGSPSNGQQNPPTEKIGVLTNGVVSGVSYSTNSSKVGTTNHKGEFSYKDGDKVKFSIGNVQLGDEVLAKARITPLELAQNDDKRTNLLIFLQSLDSDSDHDNGIDISTKAVETLKDSNINFNQSPTTFVEDLNFLKALAKANLPTTPVTPEQAKENFKKAFYKDISGIWTFSDNLNAQSPDVLSTSPLLRHI